MREAIWRSEKQKIKCKKLLYNQVSEMNLNEKEDEIMKKVGKRGKKNELEVVS